MLEVEKKKAEKLVTEMVRQAYCIVVTLSDKNEVQAFKVVLVDDSPLFNIIKADKQARIRETAVTAGALLPGGPYDLWREGETEHRVNDLVSSFANYAQLPKMLNRKAIVETLLDGCRQGLFVLRSTRKDGSCKTYWFDAPPADTLTSKDFQFAVVLSEAAELFSVPSYLLSPGNLPELWRGSELLLKDLYSYFTGRTVTIKHENYEEQLVIPRAERSVIDEAIQAAVKEKKLWLLSSRASLLAEEVPNYLLVEDAILQAPPQPIDGKEIMPDSLSEAWNREEATAQSISDALSTKLGKVLPWVTVREAINTAINSRWLERTIDSGAWPCDYSGAQAVKLCVRKEPSKKGIISKFRGSITREHRSMEKAVLLCDMLCGMSICFEPSVTKNTMRRQTHEAKIEGRCIL